MDPSVSGGDQFDLADVGLEWAAYVKITDLGDIYQEGPLNGDFDLDAVVALNTRQTPVLVQSEVRDVPELFSLRQNYPNPFNSRTRIDFFLERNTEVSIQIYTTNGQLVKTVTHRVYAAGVHNLIWNGTDDYGNKVGSGIYLARLDTAHKTRMIKMQLLR